MANVFRSVLVTSLKFVIGVFMDRHKFLGVIFSIASAGIKGAPQGNVSFCVLTSPSEVIWVFYGHVFFLDWVIEPRVAVDSRAKCEVKRNDVGFSG